MRKYLYVPLPSPILRLPPLHRLQVGAAAKRTWPVPPAPRLSYRRPATRPSRPSATQPSRRRQALSGHAPILGAMPPSRQGPGDPGSRETSHERFLLPARECLPVQSLYFSACGGTGEPALPPPPPDASRFAWHGRARPRPPPPDASRSACRVRGDLGSGAEGNLGDGRDG